MRLRVCAAGLYGSSTRRRGPGTYQWRPRCGAGFPRNPSPIGSGYRWRRDTGWSWRQEAGGHSWLWGRRPRLPESRDARVLLECCRCSAAVRAHPAPPRGRPLVYSRLLLPLGSAARTSALAICVRDCCRRPGAPRSERACAEAGSEAGRW